MKIIARLFLFFFCCCISTCSFSKNEGSNVKIVKFSSIPGYFTVISYSSNPKEMAIPGLKDKQLEYLKRTIEYGKFVLKQNRAEIIKYLSALMQTPLKENYALYKNYGEITKTDQYRAVRQCEKAVQNSLYGYLSDDPPVKNIRLRKGNVLLFFEKKFENPADLQDWRAKERGETINTYNLRQYYECYGRTNNPLEECPRLIITVELKNNNYSVELPVFDGEQYVCSLQIATQWINSPDTHPKTP